MWWALFIACAQKPMPADETSVDSGHHAESMQGEDNGPVVPDDIARWVRRMSFDLRGLPPSEADLELIKTTPEAWEAIRIQYLDDANFRNRMVHLYTERWHTRVDVFDIIAFDYGLGADEEYTFERSVGEEPLRIIAEVIAADLPWDQVVTANWTMANEMLGNLWPIDYPEGSTGWQKSHYHDERPTAGVLSTNGMWWRYTTTTANMNRKRAATISRLLLCEDYLARPVAFSEADISNSTTADAAQEDPYCLACHSSLDPIAASLFGFWWLSLYSEIEETTYHPERESLWEEYLGVAPGWYGTPISGLPDLGVSIATDSRYYSCAVESLTETLWRRETTLEDAAKLEDLRVTFLKAGTTVRPLLAAITETAEYQNDTPRMLTHDQFNSTLESLTGFRWTWNGYDQLDSDETGYRLLLGGVDGFSNKSPQQTPGLTWALVVKRAAEAAASYAVQAELDAGGERRFFQHVTLLDRPEDDAFMQELESLHLRLYGTAASDQWRADIADLWRSVHLEHGAATAWSVAGTVMLRDPAFLSY
jgi:hypothetical protein